MIYKEILLYDKLCLQIINEDIFKIICNKIKEELEIEIDLKHSINKYYKHLTDIELQILKTRRCLVSYNYNIQKLSYLYLCKIDEERHSLLINENNIYKLNIYFKNKDLYENGGTLFEGKLLNFVFIVNDYFKMGSDKITTCNFITKLINLNNIFYNDYIYDNLKDNIKIQCENYIDYKYIKSYVEDVDDKLKEYINGLIFRDVITNNNYLFIFNKMQQQLKLDKYIPEKQTEIKIKTNIDVLKDKQLIMKIIKTKEPDIYDIYYKNNYIDIADVPDLKTSIFLRDNFKKEKKPFLYFKCIYNEITNRWHPIELNLF